jgi:phenylalanyl-tRNA synthetase beta subunit
MYHHFVASAGDLGSFVTPIDITADKVNQTIGFDLSSDEIKAIFEHQNQSFDSLYQL